MLAACYLPPENSSWGTDCGAFFNHLTSLLYTYEDDFDIFIGGGDFNARMGKSNDFFEDIDDLPERQILDTVTNIKPL